MWQNFKGICTTKCVSSKSGPMFHTCCCVMACVVCVVCVVCCAQQSTQTYNPTETKVNARRLVVPKEAPSDTNIWARNPDFRTIVQSFCVSHVPVSLLGVRELPKRVASESDMLCRFCVVALSASEGTRQSNCMCWSCWAFVARKWASGGTRALPLLLLLLLLRQVSLP